MTTAERVRLTRPLPADLVLDSGAHSKPEDGMCFVEAAAFISGYWNDQPPCVSRAIGAFGRRLNDQWGSKDRQRLVPFITRIVGTATNEADELTRQWMLWNWSTRVALPMWFRLAGLEEHASALESLAPIIDRASFDLAIPVRGAARRAAIRLRDERWAKYHEIRDKAAVEAAVAAAVVAVVEAVAAVAVEAVAAVVEAAVVVAVEAVVKVALAQPGGLSSGDPLRQVIDAAIASVPKGGSVYSAVYWAVRAHIREHGLEAVTPVATALRESALQLLSDLIDVGRVEVVDAIEQGVAS